MLPIIDIPLNCKRAAQLKSVVQWYVVLLWPWRNGFDPPAGG